MVQGIIDRILERLPIVSCETATRLMSQAMERRLSVREWIDLQLHLWVCVLCVRFRRHIKSLRSLLSRYQLGGEQHLSPSAKDSIKANLRRQQ